MFELRTLGAIELLDGGGADVSPVTRQPKSLALLTYLAVTHPGRAVRRDALVGLLWPDLTESRARHALRQGLLRLRKALGADVLVGTGDDALTVDPDLLRCDAAAYASAIDEGSYEEALELYGGTFMEGFHLGGSPEFMRWVEERRTCYAREAARAAWALARRAEVEGREEEARCRGLEAGELAPYDEKRWRELIGLLDRLGDRSAAVMAYRKFAERLEEDLQLQPSPETRSLVRSIRSREEPATPGPDCTLAVVPLRDLGPRNSGSHLAAGLTEMLITELARSGTGKVVAPTTARELGRGEGPLSRIARELGADFVVRGSILRSDGRIRVTVQLVDPVTEEHVWADSFQREIEDVLTLEAEVAAAIAGELGERLGCPPASGAVERRSVDPEAHESYLRGRHHQSRLTVPELLRALRHFRRALRRDPDDPRVHAAMAETYAALGFFGTVPPSEALRKSGEAAARALEIDPGVGEAHVARGVKALLYDRDRRLARCELEAALELAPDDSLATWGYALVLCADGRCDEGIVEIERARRLDPLSRLLANTEGWMRLARGEREATSGVAAKMLELDEADPYAHWLLGTVRLAEGRPEEALARLETARRESGDCLMVRGAAGHALAVSGREDEARQLAREMEGLAEERYVPPMALAMVRAGLADEEACRDRLRQAAAEGCAWIVFLEGWPYFRPYRNRRWYGRLLREAGLVRKAFGEGRGARLRVAGTSS